MIVTAAFVVALAIGPYLAARTYARRVAAADAPLEDRLHRLERVQTGWGVVLPIVAIIGLNRLELTDRATAAIGFGPAPFGIDVLEFAVIVAVVFGVAALPFAALVAGTYPTIRSLRDTDASTGLAVKRALAGFALTAAVAAIAIGGVIAITSVVGSSFPVLVGALTVVVFLTFGLSPYLLLVFQDRVPLTGQRRDRVERLCRDLGYRPRGLYLLEGESTKAANAMVAGTVPGRRYVFLTDYLLEECDDDELRAIIAHEFGHVAGRHLWQRGLLTVAVFGGGIAAFQFFGLGALEDQFGFVGFFLPFMALYAVYHVVLLGGLAYRQELHADGYAAREAGREATVDALEVLADANDMRREAGLLYSLATHHPPIETRVRAVREAREGAESPAAVTD